LMFDCGLCQEEFQEDYRKREEGRGDVPIFDDYYSIVLQFEGQ
jgi:hypothetical protein